MNEQVRTFTGEDDFQASYAAADWLEARGFSVASSQRGAPRGILFGDFIIAKWRNLSAREKADLHGVMTGDGRRGPITVTLYAHAPEAAQAAWQDEGADA